MTTKSQEWPLWWRIIILANLSVYTTMGNFYSACVSPLVVVFAQQFHVSFTDTSHLATYAVLTIGLSNLLALPVSHFIGKRYTILLSMLIFVGVNIWASSCTSYNEFMASRIVGGLAAGIVEALGPMIVAECFVETQLASAMVIYSLALGFGASLGPITAGLIYNRDHNWPWLFNASAIIVGVNLLTSILMLPETIGGKEFEEKPTTLNSEAALDVEKMVAEQVEQATRVTEPVETESLFNLWFRRSFFLKLPDPRPPTTFSFFIEPFSLLMSPAVVFTSVVFGVLISFTVIASIIFATVLAQPPLLWTPLKVGLLNISTAVGLIVGLPSGGYLADVLYRRSIQRNDGVAVRESRLLAVLPGVIISPLGTIIIGVALERQFHWVSYAFGWMMLNVGLTAIANVYLTYCVDCYPWRSTHIGVVMNVIKNLVSFGISYAAVPWYLAVGPQKQFGTMAGILIFFMLFTVPLYIYGLRMRNWSLKYIL